MKPETEPAIVTCGNCHTAMPRELRFCRNCGYRLGEGVAEYTETVRFGNAPGSGPAGFNAYGAGSMAPFASGPVKKRKRRMSGMTWMFLGLLIFFIVAAGITAIVKSPNNMSVGITQPAVPKSYLGIDELDTAENNVGVTFGSVNPPDSPADKAGLIGGDVITSFDGQVVKEDSDLEDLLERTPIDKTVDVVFIRDGVTKTTKLTTASQQERNRLNREFERRPEGIGRFGYEEDESVRVPVPGTNIYGVRLDSIESSRPADLAGIQRGDVVIEFAGVPIRTPEELHARVRRAKPYSTIPVVIIRNGEKLEIPVKMGKL